MSGAGRAVRRDRLLGAAAFSLAAHLTILLALLLTMRTDPAMAQRPEPVTVAVLDGPWPADRTPTPSPARPTPPAPPSSSPSSSPIEAKPTPAPPHIETLPAGQTPAADLAPGLTDAELAGAASADSGPPGRACDMARWLQSALRKDPLVRAAVAQAQGPGGSAGRALMVWNGDWVQSRGEDGKGLAAVREAIMWEVAFAPPACRAEPVRGLVLISLNEGPGSARLVVGSPAWRWSDLLLARPAP